MTSPRPVIRSASSEGGFVLLLVFAMAAAVAIMLYLELPRVAFEAQRSREELLIERGEQYKRAIQLYFRKFKQYPATMEALETTNNVRFLRRRYADPLTGKDEWRLIHVGPGGVFTDSITQKKKKDDKQENRNFFITEGPAIGATIAESQRAAGPRRRASEGGQPQPGDQPGSDPNAVAAGQPGSQPLGVTNVIPPAPVSGFPGTPNTPFNPSAPQSGAMMPDGAPQPGSPGNPMPTGQPGVDPSQPGGAQAADLIRNLLTRPRPFPGSDSPTGSNMPGGGSQIGGGIAGVASKVEKPSIKIYNERDQYNEWEFIYDFAKDRTGAGQFAGTMGSGDPRLAQQQAGQAGGVAGGGFGGSGFGNTGAAGGANSSGSFGSSNSGSSNSGSSNSGGISTGYGIGSGAPQAPTPGQRQPQQPTVPQPALPGPPPAQTAPPVPPPAPPPDQTNPPPNQTPPP